MFVGLGKMLAKAGDALVMNVVAGADGRLTVTIMPKGEFKDAALGVGMTVQGTPAELDEGLAGQIERYTQKRLSLAEQVDATLSVLSAAEEASKGKATEALKKATTAKPGAAPTAKSVAAAGTQAKAGVEGGGGGALADADDDTVSLFEG